MNKELEKLVKLADAIYAAKVDSRLDIPYPELVFKTLTGGVPKVYSSLNISPTLVETYPTQVQEHILQGCNYFCRAKALPEVYDLDNNQVYETPDKTYFVYKYIPPTETCPIDEGMFFPPRLDVEEQVEKYAVYQRAAEGLVSSMQTSAIPTEDLYVNMTLCNRIAELQAIAYAQGVLANKIGSK